MAVNAGLIIYDAAGNIVGDFTTEYGRVLGSVTLVGSSGSIVDAKFLEGTPWAFPVMSFTNDFSAFSMDPGSSAPATSFSGSTLNWSRGAPASASQEAASCVLWYGVR